MPANTYISGSGTNIITLEYTVMYDHYSAKLDFGRANVLLLPPDAYVRRLSDTPTTDAYLILPSDPHTLSRYGISVNGLPPRVKDIFIPFDIQGPIFGKK